jgi:heme/copper-type cytochrome/quinol oxidase subunit 2
MKYIYNDYALNWSFNFQDPANEFMYGIIELHDKIVFYLILILIYVFWFLFSSLTQKDHLKFLQHGSLIELIWTITPALILWAIGIPSLILLYLMDEILDAEITVKAIGNQWYLHAINKSKYFANRKKILCRTAQNLEKNLPANSHILNPFWVTGFTDAEGCFSINIQIKGGPLGQNELKYISSSFKIA